MVKQLTEELDDFGSPLEEMARVWPQDSGLPMTIIILAGEGLPHGPRIKVSNLYGGKVRPDSVISVTIEDKPKFIGKTDLSTKDQKKIIEFILKNKETLNDHYYGKISDKEALNKLQAV